MMPLGTGQNYPADMQKQHEACASVIFAYLSLSSLAHLNHCWIQLDLCIDLFTPV